MRCDHCGSEWNVKPEIASRIAACPFCGSSLSQKVQRYESLGEVLIAIKEQFGIDALLDDNKYRGLFLDFAPHLSKYKRLLDCFADISGPKKVFDSQKESQEEQLIVIKGIASEMQAEMFIDEKTAYMVCDAFSFAIVGIHIENEKASVRSQGSASPTVNTPPQANGPAAVPFNTTRTQIQNDKQSSDRYSVSSAADTSVAIDISSSASINGMEIENGVLVRYTGTEANVTIPDGVTSIGQGAFMQCSCLESVVIPNGVTQIEPFAFMACAYLQKVSLPDGLVSIGECAFRLCADLQSIVIPLGVTKLSHSIFHSCTSLSSVTIPGSVRIIEKQAFCRCINLESITIPSKVKSVETGAFSNSGIKDVHYHGRLDFDAAFMNTPWYRDKYRVL